MKRMRPLRSIWNNWTWKTWVIIFKTGIPSLHRWTFEGDGAKWGIHQDKQGEGCEKIHPIEHEKHEWLYSKLEFPIYIGGHLNGRGGCMRWRDVTLRNTLSGEGEYTICSVKIQHFTTTLPLTNTYAFLFFSDLGLSLVFLTFGQNNL